MESSNDDTGFDSDKHQGNRRSTSREVTPCVVGQRVRLQDKNGIAIDELVGLVSTYDEDISVHVTSTQNRSAIDELNCQVWQYQCDTWIHVLQGQVRLTSKQEEELHTLNICPGETAYLSGDGDGLVKFLCTVHPTTFLTISMPAKEFHVSRTTKEEIDEEICCCKPPQIVGKSVDAIKADITLCELVGRSSTQDDLICVYHTTGNVKGDWNRGLFAIYECDLWFVVTSGKIELHIGRKKEEDQAYVAYRIFVLREGETCWIPRGVPVACASPQVGAVVLSVGLFPLEQEGDAFARPGRLKYVRRKGEFRLVS